MSIPNNFKGLCIDFLYAYSDIETIRTNKELDKKINNLSKDIINIIPTEEVKNIKQKDLQQYKGIKLENECILCTNGNESKSISLLRHLRNSIAHGNLHQNGNYFELEDWDNSKKDNLTALGKFDKNRIKRLLELFRQ